MRLAGGIILVIDAIAFAALAGLIGWISGFMTNPARLHVLMVVVAPAAVLCAVSSYFGARLIFVWLREEAKRQAARIANF